MRECGNAPPQRPTRLGLHGKVNTGSRVPQEVRRSNRPCGSLDTVHRLGGDVVVVVGFLNLQDTVLREVQDVRGPGSMRLYAREVRRGPDSPVAAVTRSPSAVRAIDFGGFYPREWKKRSGRSRLHSVGSGTIPHVPTASFAETVASAVRPRAGSAGGKSDWRFCRPLTRCANPSNTKTCPPLRPHRPPWARRRSCASLL